ncbi:LOW QUALITY PROTEIN: hypothetical protein ACHAW5_007039 [Stephanodiscus triporus]|uniref:Uncharacterized protein n=1 Tax=Stephanodiscus triporus TaxID=2934178 RepID=A0ABD3NRH6_9STRA
MAKKAFRITLSLDRLASSRTTLVVSLETSPSATRSKEHMIRMPRLSSLSNRSSQGFLVWVRHLMDSPSLVIERDLVECHHPPAARIIHLGGVSRLASEVWRTQVHLLIRSHPRHSSRTLKGPQCCCTTDQLRLPHVIADHVECTSNRATALIKHGSDRGQRICRRCPGNNSCTFL